MSDPTPSEPVSLTIEILRELRQDMNAFRAETTTALAEMQTLILATFDRTKRLERRLEEVRDDLETTIKMEIMGRLANFRTEMEKRLDSRPSS